MTAVLASRVEAQVLDIGKIQHPEFSFIRAWWENSRAGRVGPARSEVDPVALKSVLAHLTLIEFDPKHGSFRFRLAGTYIHQLHNREIAYTGVDEMEPPAYRELLNKHYRETIETGAPNAYEIRFFTPDLTQRHYLTLRLPLSEDGERADGILTLDIFGAGWNNKKTDISAFFPRVD